MGIRRTITLLAVAAAAATVIGHFVPTWAAAAKKPDLVVDPERLSGRGYDLIGKRYTLSIRDATKNKGRRIARPSTTMVLLQPPVASAGAAQKVSRRAISGLRPREKDKGSPRLGMVNEAPAGEYDVIACADWKDDVDESDEGNNCADVRGGRFYSVYDIYRGTLSGSAWGGSFTPDTTETWSSTDAEVRLNSYARNGTFNYVGSGGTVTFAQSGTHNGCSYSGGGSVGVASAPGEIQIQHGAQRYFGGLSAAVDSYRFQRNCGGQITNLDGPTGGHLMNLFPPGAAHPFGSTALEGQGGDPFFGEEYSWDLEGRSAG